mgnify:CR=1 FL=1
MLFHSMKNTSLAVGELWEGGKMWVPWSDNLAIQQITGDAADVLRQIIANQKPPLTGWEVLEIFDRMWEKHP